MGMRSTSPTSTQVTKTDSAGRAPALSHRQTDMTKTDDTRIQRLRPLLPPAILLEELPCSDAAADVVQLARTQAEAIITGDDDRLLCVVGPCSMHDPTAALEYAARLKTAASQWSDALLIVMRVYFEKPRTTVGWKGHINDPHLDESYDINHGLRSARALLVGLAGIGVPVGTEYLDTISPQFLSDLVAWGAIGARTTESQVHRELASGLSMPVGFKNGTGGNIRIAVDAIRSAKHPHCFLSVTKQGISAIVETRGNTACHVILRGGSEGPNYDDATVARATSMLAESGLPAHVMIDCSHGNSGKDPERQPEVAKAVAARIARGERGVMGVMLESHLVGGRQDCTDPAELTYGQSITDGCLAWEQTVPVLQHLADAVRARRARSEV
ncbi:MAG: 3-deoxy-7-phosphoheptulonate synthase [Bradymonadia bacterium]|jgi:3-deoxy-7-phosphoheptulonate synthase